MRYRGPDTANHAHQILIDRPAPGGIAEIDEGSKRRRAVIIDQYIDAVVVRDRLLDDACAVLRPANIALDGQELPAGLGRQPVPGRAERRLAPRRYGNPYALLREGARDCVTDPLAGAVDDRNLVPSSPRFMSASQQGQKGLGVTMKDLFHHLALEAQFSPVGDQAIVAQQWIVSAEHDPILETPRDLVLQIVGEVSR